MGAVETLKEQTGLIKKPTTIHQYLETLKPQVALALPKHLNAERMIRIALTCLRTNPALMDCDPQTILASVMLASQLGLEPGVLGQCFLIPYKKTCTLVPGWLGILDLVNRSGKAVAWTGAVYAGDEFDWSLGDRPHIDHKPCGDETTLTHCYAVARVKGSDWPIIEVWPERKVTAHRDKFNKVGNMHYSFKHLEMYGRKVALLQALKYVPRSIELATAMNLDASAEMGTQRLEIGDVKGVLERHTVEPEVPEPKADNIICAECRAVNGHLPSCPQRKQPNAAPTEAKDGRESKDSPKGSKNRFAALFAKAGERKIPEEDVKRYAYETHDVASMTDLTEEQLTEVTKWVNEVPND